MQAVKQERRIVRARKSFMPVFYLLEGERLPEVFIVAKRRTRMRYCNAAAI
jgi:hypothetical protein